MPDPLARGPQPVPFVIEPQQYLGHGQADQFGVGDLRRLARPRRADPQAGMMWSVSST